MCANILSMYVTHFQLQSPVCGINSPATMAGVLTTVVTAMAQMIVVTAVMKEAVMVIPWALKA